MSSFTKKKNAGNLNDYIPEYINMQLAELNKSSEIDSLNRKLDEFYVNLQGQITKYNQINNQIAEYTMEQINEIKENCQHLSESGTGQSFNDDLSVIEKSIKMLNSKIDENSSQYQQDLQEFQKNIRDLYNKIDATSISSEQIKYEFDQLKNLYTHPITMNSDEDLLELKEQISTIYKLVHENQTIEISNKVDELKQLFNGSSSTKNEQAMQIQIEEMKNTISEMQTRVERAFDSYEISQKLSTENYIHLLENKLTESMQLVDKKISEKLILGSEKVEENLSHYSEYLRELKNRIDDLYNKTANTAVSSDQMMYKFDQLKELYKSPLALTSDESLIELKEQISTIYKLMNEGQTAGISNKIDELKQLYNELSRNNIENTVENQIQEVKNSIIAIQDKMEENAYRHEALQRLSKESYAHLLETKLEESTQLVDEKISEKLNLELEKIGKNICQHSGDLQEFKNSIDALYSKIETSGIFSEGLKHELDQLKDLYVQSFSENSNAELLELKEQIAIIYELMHEEQTTEVSDKIDELKQMYNEFHSNNIEKTLENQIQEINNTVLTIQNNVEKNFDNYKNLQELSEEKHMTLLESKLVEAIRLVEQKVSEKFLLEFQKDNQEENLTPQDINQVKEAIERLYQKVSEQPMDLRINLDVQELKKQISMIYKNISGGNNFENSEEISSKFHDLKQIEKKIDDIQQTSQECEMNLKAYSETIEKQIKGMDYKHQFAKMTDTIIKLENLINQNTLNNNNFNQKLELLEKKLDYMDTENKKEIKKVQKFFNSIVSKSDRIKKSGFLGMFSKDHQEIEDKNTFDSSEGIYTEDLIEQPTFVFSLIKTKGQDKK